MVNHLDDSSMYYRHFLAEPVASHNIYNADTEAPTTQDASLATVADTFTQAQLRWERYLQRLNDGAWGDHIAIQGICNMLNITVSVLTTQNPSVTPIVPTSGTSENSVYIGLIMQYHYVGLDKVPITDETTINIGDPLHTATVEKGDEHTSSSIAPAKEQSSDFLLDDATIEKGDEHTSSSIAPTKEQSSDFLLDDATIEKGDEHTSSSIAPAKEQSSDFLLDDATIEKGDEHTRKITDGPQESILLKTQRLIVRSFQ